MSDRPQNIGIKAIELYFPSQVWFLIFYAHSNDALRVFIPAAHVAPHRKPSGLTATAVR
jgi:hypothetical protein